MENNFLTPLQLWNDYDPKMEPLHTAYKEHYTYNNCSVFTAFINGDKYDNENVRIYVKGYTPFNTTVKNTVIYANEYLTPPSQKFIDSLLNDGCAVYYFDYSGINTYGRYTKYPKAIDYCNIINSGEHLKKAIPTAKDTCIFNWCKVCRKVINLVQQFQGEDAKIILIGEKEGADIALQTAAIDKRISGVISILNAGWKEYNGISAFDTESQLVLDEERKRWLLASATQAYIKFITCPILFVGSTNSRLTSVDRIDETLKIIAENNVKVTQSLAVGFLNSVTIYEENLIHRWIETQNNNKSLPNCPTLSYVKDDNKQLIANIAFDKTEEITEINLYYSINELDPKVRPWHKISLSVVSKSANIPVYDHSKIVFAFVSVKYKNGYCLSSTTQSIKINSEEFTLTQEKSSRIIYQRSTGLGIWVVDDTNETFDTVMPELKVGGLDISGVTASKGNLSTYVISEGRETRDNQNILQFNAFSDYSRVLSVVICSGEFGAHEDYYATISVKANEWQKCSLSLQDFMSTSLVHLKEWTKVKKITFLDIDDTIISNILWV